jgi:pimeloyl-ACP methyl ester carboxylesterase
MTPVRVDEHRVASFDGTDLACHVTGEGAPILLANGLGGSWMAWRHQIAYLQNRYRFISWDYRGLYRSAPPSDPDRITVADHTRDALAVLDAHGVERAAVFGWSMGVQVGLELFRQAPERVACLVLVNGVAGNPWESVLDLRVMGRVVPRLVRTLRAMPTITHTVIRRVVRWPETVTWFKRMGIASNTLDEDLFRDLATSYAELDMDRYLHIMEALGRHDAHAVLPEVDVPCLVIAGDRDFMTPRRAAELIVRRVRGAELMVVPGASHYAMAEYPELVNLRIDKFFRERGYAFAQPRLAKIDA